MTSPVMSAMNSRSTYFFIGDALRIALTGGRIPYSNVELSKLKRFIEGEDVNYREQVSTFISAHVNNDDIQNFDQVLIQQTVEEAIELTNPVCTVQLRNIVYIHNQLIKYGHHI